MIIKIIRAIFNLALHLLAIAALAFAFWPFADLALRASKLVGYDSDQFIYYVNLYGRSFALPPASWDHFWFEGFPRVLDYVFLPHYLIQPLVGQLGLAMATKAYPLFWLGFFFLTAYFLFYRLSKNQLFAFLITLGVMYSPSIYLPVYENGVVTSGLAQSVFPAILLFLVLFAQTKSFRYLGLAALALAFQLYNHGGLALAFGFAPAVIFLTLFRFEKEKFISFDRFKRLIGFGLMTFGVAALATAPQILDALEAGVYSRGPFGQASSQPEIFNRLTEVTHPVLLVATGLAILIGIIFYRKRFGGLFLSLTAILLYFLLFITATALGKNPFGDFLFPGRIVWFFAVILGCVSSLLLSPLTASYKSRWRFLLPLTWLTIGGVMVFILVSNPFRHLDKFKPFAGPAVLGKTEGDEALLGSYRKDFRYMLKEIDPNDTNFRIWNHSGGKLTWNIISDVPQAEGYFHYRTKYSVEWIAWFNATLVEEVVRNQTIPQDMADKQGLFLIDWFGVKYLYASPGEEFNLAPRFWQENDYVLRKSADQVPATFIIRPEFTSGIVEAVKVPVVGFIGSDDGYNIFLRDLAMLNLNTHYLIPLRLGQSINDVSKDDLGNLDLLVLYGLNNKGGDWGKIADFVKNGGSLFIETGGNTVFIEEENLPEVFPMNQLKFGSLGREWKVGKKGEISSIDFAKLKPLVYQGQPWKLSYVEDQSVLRERSDILLTQAGKPIITEQNLGNGKVIWAGLNSWYRPWELKENGIREVEIISIILKRLLKTPYVKPLDIKIQREKPEKIIIEGTGFSGVILKENNLGGWRGYAEANGQRQNLKLYAAGPDFMYFSMPKKLKNEFVKVQILYPGQTLYWFLFIASVLSFIFVTEEIISGGFLSSKFAQSKLGGIINFKPLVKNIKGWWEKDEDEE